MKKRRVWICSPFSGDVERNTKYPRACMRDAIRRGEVPIAGHLLFTQPGILDDTCPEERALGMQLGQEWMAASDAVAVYLDLGQSSGMVADQDEARRRGVHIETRFLGNWAPNPTEEVIDTKQT